MNHCITCGANPDAEDYWAWYCPQHEPGYERFQIARPLWGETPKIGLTLDPRTMTSNAS